LLCVALRFITLFTTAFSEPSFFTVLKVIFRVSPLLVSWIIFLPVSFEFFLMWCRPFMGGGGFGYDKVLYWPVHMFGYCNWGGEWIFMKFGNRGAMIKIYRCIPVSVNIG